MIVEVQCNANLLRTLPKNTVRFPKRRAHITLNSPDSQVRLMQLQQKSDFAECGKNRRFIVAISMKPKLQKRCQTKVCCTTVNEIE